MEKPEQLKFPFIFSKEEKVKAKEEIAKKLDEIISSEEEFKLKYERFIKIAAGQSPGEEVCRDFYYRRVGVPFRGISDRHSLFELVNGILNPEIEKTRLGNLDREEDISEREGLYKR